VHPMHSRSDASATPTTQPRPAPIELSIIDLVLAATESSEDEFEVNDGIAQLIESGEVRILAREQDPMLRRVAALAPERAA